MQKIENAMVIIMFIILTTQFTHFELPLCYFMSLFNIEKGYPLPSPCQLQKARDNTEARLCLQEEKKKIAPETILLTMYSLGKVVEN